MKQRSVLSAVRGRAIFRAAPLVFALWLSSGCANDPASVAPGQATSSAELTTCVSSADVVLVLDTSESMKGINLLAEKSAAVAFLNAIDRRAVRIGEVDFSNTASVHVGFTQDLAALTAGINNLGSSGDTNLGTALGTTGTLLASSTAPKRIVIVFSDGDVDDLPAASVNAAALKNAGVELWVVHIAGALNAATLASLATDAGRYFVYTAATQMTSVAAAISAQICAVDGDGDGVLDDHDNCPTVSNPTQVDTDGDGQGDACDGDDDNDGVADGIDNCAALSNPAQEDSDADGQGNACDSDDDNDGVGDGNDNCPLVANPSQSDRDRDGLGDVCDGDLDGDGVTDAVDNCPRMRNPEQVDTDHDGAGNPCDGDDDNDGVADAVDNCNLLQNPNQLDTDGDHRGNVCDGDDDDDGVADAADDCQIVSNADQLDTDGDGRGDACDRDDDNDGVIDPDDNCPLVANPTQQVVFPKVLIVDGNPVGYLTDEIRELRDRLRDLGYAPDVLNEPSSGLSGADVASYALVIFDLKGYPWRSSASIATLRNALAGGKSVFVIGDDQVWSQNGVTGIVDLTHLRTPAGVTDVNGLGDMHLTVTIKQPQHPVWAGISETSFTYNWDLDQTEARGGSGNTVLATARNGQPMILTYQASSGARLVTSVPVIFNSESASNASVSDATGLSVLRALLKNTVKWLAPAQCGG